MKWIEVATVASETTPDKTYTIKRYDDRLGCSCPAYRFARGERKTCKHIQAWQWGAESLADRQMGESLSTHVNVQGERFTVKLRAMSFGGL